MPLDYATYRRPAESLIIDDQPDGGVVIQIPPRQMPPLSREALSCALRAALAVQVLWVLTCGSLPRLTADVLVPWLGFRPDAQASACVAFAAAFAIFAALAVARRAANGPETISLNADAVHVEGPGFPSRRRVRADRLDLVRIQIALRPPMRPPDGVELYFWIHPPIIVARSHDAAVVMQVRDRLLQAMSSTDAKTASPFPPPTEREGG